MKLKEMLNEDSRSMATRGYYANKLNKLDPAKISVEFTDENGNSTGKLPINEFSKDAIIKMLNSYKQIG